VRDTSDLIADGSARASHERADARAQAVSAFQSAAAMLLQSPLDETATDLLTRSTEQFAACFPGGGRAFNQRRSQQLKDLGGYVLRYVLMKDFDNTDALIPLSPPRPARDGIRSHLMRIAAGHPHLFPGGIAGFLERERPIVQVGSRDFLRIISTSTQFESETLAAAKPAALLAKLVDLFEQLAAYRNLAQLLAEAHPTAVERIDQGDADGMIEFLAGIGKRAPLSSSEFQRFLDLSRQGWENASDSDVVLRGRIVHAALDGKAPVLRKWVTPFVRYLSAHGQLPQLLERFRQRSPTREPAAPRPFEARPVSPQPAVEQTPADAGGDDSGRYVVPLNTPEPPKLHVLRNYLKCGSMSTTVALDHALQMAGAQADVPGHRLHVLRIFQEEGWLMEPRGKREPIFKRRPPVEATILNEHSGA